MSKSQLQKLKSLEKENSQLKKIVADLKLDKLILKDSLDYLKRRPDDCRSVSGSDSYAPEVQITRGTHMQNDRRGQSTQRYDATPGNDDSLAAGFDQIGAESMAVTATGRLSSCFASKTGTSITRRWNGSGGKSASSCHGVITAKTAQLSDCARAIPTTYLEHQLRP